jgi:hypothetical protein
VAPRDGPLQNGPLILDPHGKFVGANALGYLSFDLTTAGQAAIAQSAKHGNQFGVHLALSDATAKASGDIALIRVK